MDSRFDAIVIGLGGMGSAAAFHVARRGRRVLGLEQFETLHERGSSHGLTRIIRLAYHEHPSYVPMLRRSYELWHELEALAGEKLLITTGSIEGGPEDGPTFRGSLAAAQLHELPHEVLDPVELRQRFPGYRAFDAGTRVVFQPDGGFLLAERSLLAHLNQASAHGAELHFNEPLREWMPRATVASWSAPTAPRMRRIGWSCASGAWAGKVVPRLAPLARPERQVLAWFQPHRPRSCSSPAAFRSSPCSTRRRAAPTDPRCTRSWLQDRPLPPPAPSRWITDDPDRGVHQTQPTRPSCAVRGCATSRMLRVRPSC